MTPKADCGGPRGCETRVNSFRKRKKIRKVRLFFDCPAFHPPCVKGLGMAAAAAVWKKKREKGKKRRHPRQFSIMRHRRFQVSQVAVEGQKHNDSVATPHLAMLSRGEAERRPFSSTRRGDGRVGGAGGREAVCSLR